MWFSDHWSNGNFSCDLRRVFRARELLVFLREALLSRINSNSLTCTVASSFCLHLAAGNKVPPADHMDACSGVHHKLSGLRFYCGCGRQTPLIGRRNECSFFLFFEPQDILGKSPHISAGASLLSFSLLLRSVLKFDSVGTALMRKFDLYFFQRWDLCFLGCLHDAATPLVNRARRIGPKTSVPFRKNR